MYEWIDWPMFQIDWKIFFCLLAMNLLPLVILGGDDDV